MTSRGQCPRGGGCLWMSKSGGVSQFSGGQMTSRRQCPRGGGGGACEIPPPSGNPVSAPVICVKFWAVNPSAPPNQSGPIRLCVWVYVCVLCGCMCGCMCVCCVCAVCVLCVCCVGVCVCAVCVLCGCMCVCCVCVLCVCCVGVVCVCCVCVVCVCCVCVVWVLCVCAVCVLCVCAVCVLCVCAVCVLCVCCVGVCVGVPINKTCLSKFHQDTSPWHPLPPMVWETPHVSRHVTGLRTLLFFVYVSSS